MGWPHQDCDLRAGNGLSPESNQRRWLHHRSPTHDYQHVPLLTPWEKYLSQPITSVYLFLFFFFPPRKSFLCTLLSSPKTHTNNTQTHTKTRTYVQITHVPNHDENSSLETLKSQEEGGLLLSIHPLKLPPPISLSLYCFPSTTFLIFFDGSLRSFPYLAVFGAI